VYEVEANRLVSPFAWTISLNAGGIHTVVKTGRELCHEKNIKAYLKDKTSTQNYTVLANMNLTTNNQVQHQQRYTSV
jgi:hypothetical protein